jgi:hypothetical protein
VCSSDLSAGLQCAAGGELEAASGGACGVDRAVGGSAGLQCAAGGELEAASGGARGVD